MKTTFLTILLSFTILYRLTSQCQIITLPYGQQSADVNSSNKIIPTQDGNFVIAGVWNDEAFMLKIDASGQQLVLKKYGSDITGQSELLDVIELPDGGFVAVGECDNCGAPNDTLRKVVALKTDANLNLDATIGVKKFGMVTLPGGGNSLDEQVSPRILQAGNTFLMVSGVTIGSIFNWQDICVTQLSSDLTPLWFKVFNTAPNAYFEIPADIVATDDGYIMPVFKAFQPDATLVKIDHNGNVQWSNAFIASSVRGITYLTAADEVAVIGDRTLSGQTSQALIMRFAAGNGTALDSLLLGSGFLTATEGYDIQTLPNGELLAAIHSVTNFLGESVNSNIYRIRSDTLEATCFYPVSKPNNVSRRGVTSIVPLSVNGKDFAATGFQTPTLSDKERAFFHIRKECEVAYINAAICPGESYLLPDGAMVNAAGTYNSVIATPFGCDSVVQTTLSVYPLIPPTVEDATLCPGESYVLPGGATVNVAGTYADTLDAVNGCDSVVQTNLSYFTPIPPTTIQVVLCPGEAYMLENGELVDTAGIYALNYSGANGCDSIVEVHVGIFDTIFAVVVGMNPDTGPQNGSISLDSLTGGTPPYQFAWNNGASGSSVSNLSSGTYQVTVTDAAGCTAVFNYTIDLIIGTHEVAPGLAFRLYPNPFNNQIHVALETENPKHAIYELRFFDVHGRLFQTHSIPEGAVQTIGTAQLAAGVYMAQLIKNEKVILNRRMMKQ